MSAVALGAEQVDRGGDAHADLQRIRSLFGVFGITRVADVTGLDIVGIPVAVCVRPTSKNLAVSQGKGLTRDLAFLSAIMESVEDYHSENVRAAELLGSVARVRAECDVLLPEEVSRGAFRCRPDADAELEWLSGTNVISGRAVLVPRDLVSLDLTGPRPEFAHSLVSSTGLATGRTWAEAVCHGLFEVVERDAYARWDALGPSERSATRVDVKTIRCRNAALIERFWSADIGVDVWDLTPPLGIPTYRCTITDRNPLRRIGIFGGVATHPSPVVALSRALTEAAQSRLTMISGSRDDVFPERYPRLRRFTSPFVEGGERAMRYEALFGDARGDDLLRATLERFAANGYGRVLIVDHTRAELGIPVVHAFVPGMRDILL